MSLSLYPVSTNHPPPSSKSGMVLWVVTLVLSALGVLGITIYTSARVDVAMSGNHKKTMSAFYHADAGIRHVAHQIKNDAKSGVLVLDSPTETVNYTAPAGFTFDTVTQLTRMPDNESYLFTVVGRSLDAQVTIEAVLSGIKELPYGFFGDDSISMGPSTELHSYDPDVVIFPTPADCTELTRAATNGEMVGGMSAVHGSATLGKDTLGNQATYNNAAPPTDVYLRDRIDPDPLGAVGGVLGTKFVDVQTVNNNGNAVGGILNPDGSLEIRGDMTLVAGDYWVNEIVVGNHETLTVDGTAGPVNIYLTGPAYNAGQGDIITIPPRSENLHIFSNASDTIEFKPKSDFIGTIYAPLAQIVLKPNGYLLGAAWGWQLNLQPGNGLYEDSSSGFGMKMPGSMDIASWQQVQ